jgi:hypothetical protein
MPPTIYIKRGLNDALTAVNPVLGSGEMVFVRDTNTIVVGDGSGVYSSLSGIYANPLTHTHTSNDITNWNEAVDDRVSSLLVAGTGINLSYNDSANTLTVNLASASVTGVGTSNYVARWTTANSIGTGVIYDNGSVVGIGTDSPSQFNSSFNQLVIGGGSAYQGATIYSTTQGSLAFGDTATDLVDGYRGYLAYIHDTDYMLIGTAGAERVRITAAGNVGIGTTGTIPTSRLQVEGGNIVFNDNGGNYDFRIESTGNASIFFVDASADAIGIGTSTPSSTLHIRETTTPSLRIHANSAAGTAVSRADRGHIVFPSFTEAYDHIKLISWGREANFLAGMLGINISNSAGVSSEVLTIDNQSTASTFGLRTYNIPLVTTSGNVIFNTTQDNYDFTVKGDGDDELLVVDASTDRVGIGVSLPLQKLDIRYPVSGGMALIKDSDTNDGLLFGDMAYSVSAAYQGIKHVSMTGTSDYMMMSAGTDNHVSAKAGSDLYLRAGGNSTTSQIKLTASEINVNDFGADCDFRIEGVSEQNLFYLDASENNIGIGTATPSHKLHIADGAAYIQSGIISPTIAFRTYDIPLSGPPTWEGFIAYQNSDCWGLGNSSNDGFVFEKTDGNQNNPDGGIFFNVRGSGGVSSTAMSINGSKEIFIGQTGTNIVQGYSLNLKGGATVDSFNINNQFTFPTTDGSADQVLVTDGSGVLTWQDQFGAGTILNQTVNGRLTLESGEPVSTTDQTAKTTLYFTPYKGNQIALYNGTAWGIHSFSELSLSLSGYTADTNYDIFVYDNSGTLTLESTAWTDGTTRATALDTQNGVYVKSGATTRRYLGTIRTTATTGQCEDSEDRRFVFNYYNQTRRKIQSTIGSPTGNHTYTTATWRSYYNSTTVGTTRNEFVIGIDQLTRTDIMASFKLGYVCFGYDSTSLPVETDVAAGDFTSTLNTHAFFGSQVLSDGYHYVQAMEYGQTGGVFHFMTMETHILC